MLAGIHDLGGLLGLAGPVAVDHEEYGSKGGQSSGVIDRAENERG